MPFVDVLNTMLDETLPLTPPEWPEWGEARRLVFSRKLRTELEQVRATAAALNVPDVRERIEKANSGDNVKLGNDLQTLITRMNEESALGGR
jgi:hypothetical protein